MKDIGLVVMLSDNLERHRFVEQCKFVEIFGADAAILSTWRHMLVRAACVVVSLEASNISKEQIGGLLTAIRSDAATTLRRNRLWKPLQTYVILGCNSDLYDQLTPLVPKLVDRSGLQTKRIVGISIIDRGNRRVIHVNGNSHTLGTCLAPIPDLVDQWVQQQCGLAEAASDASRML
ncbi:MAG: hypothetical protein WCP35_08400 [Verrucomicrobiota bacterium]